MDNGVEFQNSGYNDWHVFSTIGRIDVATSAAVEEAGAAALTAAEKIAVDMSKTDYISSAGLRVCASARRQSAPKKRS